MARMRNSSKLEFRTSPDEPRTRPGDDSPDPVTTYTSLRNVEYCTSLSGYANGGYSHDRPHESDGIQWASGAGSWQCLRITATP